MAALQRVVKVEGRKEWHLMEALLTKGPMTVSIDASADSFMFYKEGLYSEPNCATRPQDLDHAVMVSGWVPTKLAGWLVGGLVGCLVGGLVGWLVEWVVGWEQCSLVFAGMHSDPQTISTKF